MSDPIYYSVFETLGIPEHDGCETDGELLVALLQWYLKDLREDGTLDYDTLEARARSRAWETFCNVTNSREQFIHACDIYNVEIPKDYDYSWLSHHAPLKKRPRWDLW